MGTVGEKSAPKNRKTSTRPAGPGLAWRLWRFTLDHPKGVLIGSATLLGLIVVFQNWRPTTAYLLVTDVSLPFIVWALVFMLVGYLTGKWVEWAWRQRKIRKGTYKPKISAEALADAGANLDERLDRKEGGSEGALRAGSKPGDGEADAEDPATIIERGEGRKGRADEGIAFEGAHWDAPRDASGAGGKVPADDRPRGPSERHRNGGYSPAVEDAARGSGPAPRFRRGPDDRRGDYGDAGHYADHGGGRYADHGGGRYVDQGGGQRYVDYGDYGDGGRYVDQGGGGRYVDQSSDPRYGDYGDSGRQGGPDPRRR